MRERRRGRRRELLYQSVDEPAADERCVFIREQTKASSSSHGSLTSLPLFLVLLSDWRLSILCPKRIMFPENENRPGFFFSAPLPPPAPRCSGSFSDDIFGGSGGFLSIQTQFGCFTHLNMKRLSCESYSARWSRYEKFVCWRRTVDFSCFRHFKSIFSRWS